MSAIPTLPSGTHLIHIGPPKTGSTTLQFNLLRNRPELNERGVDYPTGKHDRPRMAGWWVTGSGAPVGRRAPEEADWLEYVAEVQACDRERMIISTEVFAQADEDAARRIVQDIGGEHPHMVYVVRSMDRFFASYYQERVKARLKLPYGTWLESMLNNTTANDSARNFIMGAQQVGEVVERWAKVMGHENITLVIADESDRDSLPTAFAQMLGLPDDFLFGKDTNTSLSWPASEVLRRVNTSFHTEKESGENYHRFVQRGMITQIRDAKSTRPKVKFPASPTALHPLVEAAAQAQYDAVVAAREAGVRVIGDLEVLRRVRPADDTPDPDMIDVDEAAEMVFAMYRAGADRQDYLQGMFDRQRAKVINSREKLVTTRANLTNTRAKLTTTRAKLTTTQANLSKTKESLTRTNQQLTKARERNAKARARIAHLRTRQVTAVPAKELLVEFALRVKRKLLRR